MEASGKLIFSVDPDTVLPHLKIRLLVVAVMADHNNIAYRIDPCLPMSIHNTLGFPSMAILGYPLLSRAIHSYPWIVSSEATAAMMV